MSPREALDAFEQAMSSAAIQIGIFDVDWSQFIKKRETGGVIPSYFTKLVRTGTQQSSDGASKQRQEATIRARLLEAVPARRRPLLRKFVRNAGLKVLGWDESRTLEDSAPLTDAGLDLLLSVELRNVLSRSLGLSLAATLLFDHPTIAALVDFLLIEMHIMGEEGFPVADRVIAFGPRGGSAVLAEVAGLSDEEVEGSSAADDDDQQELFSRRD